MMTKLLANRRLASLLYVFLVILTIGMGMGLPMLTIFLGFPVGWFLPVYLGLPAELERKSLASLLKASAISVLAPLLILGAIWLPALTWLYDPARDIAQFGMPLILFEPLASFIGWIILMVIVSPFLQFLMTVLGGVLYLTRKQE